LTSTPVLYVIIFLHSYIFQKYSIVKYMRGCSRWSTTLTSALYPPCLLQRDTRLSPPTLPPAKGFSLPILSPLSNSCKEEHDFHLWFSPYLPPAKDRTHLKMRVVKDIIQRWESDVRIVLYPQYEEPTSTLTLYNATIYFWNIGYGKKFVAIF